MTPRRPEPHTITPRVFLPPETVLDRFAAITGAPRHELEGRAVTPEISRLRQEAAWMLRRLSTAGLTHIGRLLGGRNIATIDEMLDKVVLRTARDEHYRDYLRELEARVIDAVSPPGPDPLATLAQLRALLANPSLNDAVCRRQALALLTEPRDAA